MKNATGTSVLLIRQIAESKIAKIQDESVGSDDWVMAASTLPAGGHYHSTAQKEITTCWGCMLGVHAVGCMLGVPENNRSVCHVEKNTIHPP